MGYYPVFLDLQGRSCLVIGAGPEAERKTHGLLEAGARVTVVSPKRSPVLEELATQGEIVLHQRPYTEGDLAGAFLAVAATTEDFALSKRIFAEAQREHVLLNVMDLPDLCTWIAPALVRRGDLTLALSTAGRSPAMARFVKEELEHVIPKEYGTLLEILAEVRHDLRQRQITPPPEAWQKALDGEIRDLLTKHDWPGVKECLLRFLEPPPEPAERVPA